MSNTINDIRIKLFARSRMGIADDNEFVEWAIQELLYGNNSESISILAGLESPLNHFEVQFYVEKCKKELNINFDDSIVDQYAIVLARQKLDNKVSSKIISEEMMKIYYFTNFNSKYKNWFNIDEFYDDYFIVSDKNIEDVIKEECKKILLIND